MIYRLVISAILFLVVTGARAAEDSGKLVDITVSKAFIPIGFDTNDRAQTVVAGTFHNTCYRVGPNSVHIDETAKTIEVLQWAYEYSGMCLQIEIPFTQVVELGLVNEGEYTLLDAKSGSRLGKMPVTRATKSAPDDYLYAIVTGAHVTGDAAQGHRLVLEGIYPDRCTRYKQTMVNYHDEVLVIQPIVERDAARSSTDCSPGRFSFRIEAPLKKGLKGTHLLHVRSLDGQAKNQLVDF